MGFTVWEPPAVPPVASALSVWLVSPPPPEHASNNKEVHANFETTRFIFSSFTEPFQAARPITALSIR